MSWLSVAIGLVPVVFLLFGMVALDSYKLVPWKRVLRSVALGAVSAMMAWALNRALLEWASVPPATLKHWIAPALEEALKLSWIVLLIRRGQVGFLVDAGIHGFAIGTGFAVVENLYYATALDQTSLLLWLARGLGTAVMHGGATAIAAIMAREVTERRGSNALRWFAPGFVMAVLVHAVFNQLPFPPLIATAIVILGVPLILIIAYETSERQTQQWLGSTLDRDVELLELIHTGAITETHVGRYLTTLRERFPGPVVADMLCLLEIQGELALRAKGRLIAQSAGIELPPDPELLGRIREMRFLERSIGPTGMLALLPFLKTRGRERWQIRMLENMAEGKQAG